MILRWLAVTLTVLISFSTSVLAADPDSGNASGQQTETAVETKTSSAVIAEKNFIFEPVVDGSTVSHDYLIKNAGDETLEILQVKTG